MKISVKQRLLDLYQIKIFEKEVLDFHDILKKAIYQLNIKSKPGEIEQYAEANLNRHWNEIIKDIEICRNKGIVPVFDIIDYYSKKLKWNFSTYFPNSLKQIKLKNYPYLMRKINSLCDRDYEVLGCVLCKYLGANNIRLTPKGNEAGIDLIATFDFGSNAHFLFGINGPIRLIGQIKKYKYKVEVKEIKEFNSTMNDVYSKTIKIQQILPSWFNKAKGPIISWFGAHSGFQSGAIDRAKNYGIILSDSRIIAQTISISKKVPYSNNYKFTIGKIENDLMGIKEDHSINMELVCH